MLQRIANLIGFLIKAAGAVIIACGIFIAAVGLLTATLIGNRDFIIVFSICLAVSTFWLTVLLVPWLKVRLLHSKAERAWWLLLMMIAGVYLSFAASGILALIGAGELALLIVTAITLLAPLSYLVLDILGLTWIFDGIHLPDVGDD